MAIAVVSDKEMRAPVIARRVLAGAHFPGRGTGSFIAGRCIPMAHNSSSLSLAYANPHPPARVLRRAGTPRRDPRVRPDVIVAIVVAAIGWLLLGCSGLLWTIAFTVDPQPLALALLVWVLAFVAPSVIATAIAYRLEEETLRDGTAGDD